VCVVVFGKGAGGWGYVPCMKWPVGPEWWQAR